MGIGGQQLTMWVDVAVDECVSEEGVLSLPGRFKSLCLAFSTPSRSMLVFRAIVQISALSMFNPGKQLAPGHAVALQFIGHDHARDKLNALQHPSKESLRGFGISPRLYEDVQHDTVPRFSIQTVFDSRVAR